MPARIEIAPEVAALLERGTWDDAVYQLPPGQLPRPLYQQVDKVLCALGGKWNRHRKGHVFTKEARCALADALREGAATDTKVLHQQYFTPPEVAARMSELVGDVRGKHVLEPSAGAGILVAEAVMYGAARIDAVELNPQLYAQLVADFPGRTVCVHCADFLQFDLGNRPDVVMMNPPFTAGQDVAHVGRALDMLRPGGTLVAVMPPGWQTKGMRAYEAFRDQLQEQADQYKWFPLPESSFRVSGTNVATGLLLVRKRPERQWHPIPQHQQTGALVHA